MAETTKKDNNPATDFEPDNTDQQTDDTAGERSQADQWIDDYQSDPLADDISNAVSNEKVSCLSYWEQKEVNDTKVCRLQNVHQVNQEYLGIKNCVSSVLKTHSERLDTRVADLMTKNTEMQTNMNTALENLKAVKSQLIKVSELACKLDIATKDGCHSEQLKAMSKLPVKNGKKGTERFKAEVKAIMEEAKDLCINGNSVFEAGVKFAGIQAFINIPSMEALAAQLKTDAAELDANVDANMTELSSKITDCQAEYQEGITTIAGNIFDYYKAQLESNALENLNNELTNLDEFECTDEKMEILRSELESICEAVEGTFEQTVNCNEETASKFKKNS